MSALTKERAGLLRRLAAAIQGEALEPTNGFKTRLNSLSTELSKVDAPDLSLSIPHMETLTTLQERLKVWAWQNMWGAEMRSAIKRGMTELINILDAIEHDTPSRLREEIERIHSILSDLTASSGGWSNFDEKGYMQLRKKLMLDGRLKGLLPEVVQRGSNRGEITDFMKLISPQYKGRREYLRKEFSACVEALDPSSIAPSDGPVRAAIEDTRWDKVQTHWRKALKRLESDPDGAISAAKSLIESVCKHILDESGEAYTGKEELPSLYSKTSKVLRIGPSQQTEDTFRRVLGHCHSVVDDLANMRNKLGDGHGTGKDAVIPERRHAELAVNLAGAMATFLVNSFKSKP